MTELRSAKWFPRAGDHDAFPHRVFMNKEAYPSDVLRDRPVIGICNSWSELTPCNLHLRRIAESVKRGIWEAGGLPLEFPTISLGETLMRPTTMFYRNLMSIDVEESIRGNPIDGVVLLAGCDKTTPAQLMGAASVDLPTMMITGGPMLDAHFQGRPVGSGTEIWKSLADVKSGEMSAESFDELEQELWRSNGHCMVMGTASSMASIVETLGVSLTGSSAIPAVDSRRYQSAQLSGRRIVAMVREDLRLSKILTREAFENAIIMNAAIGGSTNVVVHLLALAGRAGIPLDLDDFDRLGRGIPLLVNLKPAGQFLMEEFYYAGGLPAVVRELGELLHPGTMTVTGTSLVENCANAPCYDRNVVRERANALHQDAGIAVLRGNLAPSGAVIKTVAATPELLAHRGRAVVFDDVADYQKRVDDPNLDVDETSILVLRNAGPLGYPGMPEVGNFTLPQKLIERGVKDMIRISDARMSGTAFGTVVLHAAPEAALGGPIALVRSGDTIELNVPNRTLTLDVPEAELATRRSAWKPPVFARGGYAQLYREHVMQADRGADFDFLVGPRGSEPVH